MRETNRQAYVDHWNFIDDLFAQAAREQGVTLDSRHAAIGHFVLADGPWLELTLEVEGLTPEDAAMHCRDDIEQRLGIA